MADFLTNLPVIESMLAGSSEPFDSKAFHFEIKWDGTRCLAYRDNRLRLINRRHVLLNDRYPDLMALKQLPAGTVLDGEIIVLDQGKSSFNKLQQRDQTQSATRAALLAQTMPATFMAFDLLYLEGENLMSQPLHVRHARLEALVNTMREKQLQQLMYSQPIQEKGCALFEHIKQEAMEGVMAKRLNSPYQPGVRSEDWLKIKVASTMQLTVLGYVKRDGDQVVSSLLLGEKHADGWQYKGKVGSGLSEVQREGFYNILSEARTTDRPLGINPQDVPKEAAWSTANMDIVVRYFEITDTGKLRSPVFVELVRP